MKNVGQEAMGMPSNPIPSNIPTDQLNCQFKPRFSKEDIQGFYGAIFDGFIIKNANNSDPVQIPVSAVGIMYADGNGHFTTQRTVNTGGFLQEQFAMGTYKVDSCNGTGTAAMIVPGAEPNSRTLKETYRFVINRANSEIHFIGTAITDEDDRDIGLTVVTKGMMIKQ